MKDNNFDTFANRCHQHKMPLTRVAVFGEGKIIAHQKQNKDLNEFFFEDNVKLGCHLCKFKSVF